MAAALEREQIPQMSEAYQKEQLAGIALTARIGTYSGMPGENIQSFCDNVDGLMSRYGLGSWEMADIVIPQFRGDAATEVQKYLTHKTKYPGADHWCAQEAQEARDFQPYRAAVAAVPAVGNPGDDNYVPAVPAVPFQPELTRLPQLKAVTAENCLKAYLIRSFKLTISVSQALKNFSKYTQQAGNVSMRSYFNRLRTACTSYHLVKFTQTQREAPGYEALLETDLMEAAKGGMSEQFQEYIESVLATEQGADTVATFDQMEAAALKWETSTKAGQRRFAKCKPVPIVASLEVGDDNTLPEDNHSDSEDDIPKVSVDANQHAGGDGAGTASGKGGQGRGSGSGGGSNTGTKPKNGNRRSVEPINDPRYAGMEWWPEHQIPPNLKSKEKRCFYCGGLGHPRPRCPHLRDDLNKNPPVDRAHLPKEKRGYVKSRRQIKREKDLANNMAKIASAQQQFVMPEAFHPAPGQAFPLAANGRPQIMNYPPQLPSRSALPVNPGTPAFYAHGAAPNLPPDLVDGRAFTYTGNYPQGTYLTRYPYFPAQQQSQLHTQPQNHCVGPSVNDIAQMQGTPVPQQPRPHSTVSHMGAYGPYHTDGQT